MNSLEQLNFQKIETSRSVAFFAKHPFPTVTARIYDLLIHECDRKNGRICLHPDPSALWHDMIIYEHHGNIFPTHRHINKSETIHVIRGMLMIECFDDTGKIVFQERFVSGSVARIPHNVWHVNTAISETVLYHESKPGPFDPETDKEIASWETKK